MNSEDQKPVLKALMALTKASQFMNASDLAFIRSTSSELDETIDNSANKLLTLLTRMKAYVSTGLEDMAKRNQPMLSAEDVIDHYSILSDVVDNLLEKVVSLFSNPF